ncbi:MAG TPA: MmcQ/YjbR family DNA-binding protein [Acidimicrobiia bacterium]|nr:MmcQ/YjbR family DNA-binding protein [Acidimicrobiia bacterium]
MATWDEVRAIAGELPGIQARGNEWRVRNNLVAWERPLRKSDFEALGDDAPGGDILGVWLPDLAAKESLLADDPDVYFTTPHFDGYRVILIRLENASAAELEELIVEAWIDRAPKRLSGPYLRSRGLH